MMGGPLFYEAVVEGTRVLGTLASISMWVPSDHVEADGVEAGITYLFYILQNPRWISLVT